MAYTLNAAKELVAGKLPLLLVKFTFLNGSTLHLSTHAVTYGGQAYQARLSQIDLERVQMMSESGIDIPPSLTLHIADADGSILANYENGTGLGFKGARVEVRFVFYDVLAQEFSTDSLIRYTGICDAATPTDDVTLEVRTTNRLNASKKMVPTFLISKYCPKIRPATVSQCAAALNEESDFYPCGLAVPGADCYNTREGCTAIGNIRRFAGVTYAPPKDGGMGREYVSGNEVRLRNSSNDAKYGEPWPVILGRGWVQAPVLHTRRDGNYTRVEVGLCVGRIDTGNSATLGMRVVVNGNLVPPGGYDSPGGWVALNPGNVMWWNWVSRGYRDGNVPTRFNGKEDPYGSLTVIECVLPRQEADGEGDPQVSVLFSGPQIRTYSAVNTHADAWTDNPAWHLMWALIQSGWTYAELDTQSFINAAAVCAENVSYSSQYGTPAQHARYKSNVVLRQRRPASEIIRGIRQNMCALLQPNRDTGKLSVVVKGTLADQQPAPVAGSNYNTPIVSITRNGVIANGYAAYKFSEDNCISIKGIPRPITDCPNRLALQLQDSENNFAQTSLVLVESDDVERVGQEVASSVSIDGCGTYDQGVRLLKVQHKEAHRGNPAGDTRGTRWYEIVTSVRAIRVCNGQIGLVDWAKLGLSGQAVRIHGVKGPSKDGTVTLTAAIHDDVWYIDSLSQRPDPAYSNPRRDKLSRASYPLCPDLVAARAGDPWYSASDKTFKVTPKWTISPTGSWNGQITVLTKIPVNLFSDIAQPPQIALQALVATNGGSLDEGLYFVALSAVDANGKHSPLSIVAQAHMPEGTTNGVVTVPVQWWDNDAVSWNLYAGRTPFLLSWQASGAGHPSSVSLSAWLDRRGGAPDPELDAVVAVGKEVVHSGIIGAQIQAVDTDSIAIGGEGWGVDALAGREISVVAKSDYTELPILNYSITANTADGVCTVTPDPALDGLDIGDVVVVRSKPVVSNGGKTLTDALWENPFYPAGMNPDQEVGKLARIIHGTGTGLTNHVTSATSTSHSFSEDWAITPDSTSRIIIEEPAWLPLASPLRPINNANPDTVKSFQIPNENYANRMLLIGLRTEDGGQAPNVEALTPVREMWITGKPETIRTVTADYTVVQEDQTILCDTSGGSFTITLPSSTSMTGRNLWFWKKTDDANTATIQNASAVTLTVLSKIDDGFSIKSNG
jgi:hypothetical protein